MEGKGNVARKIDAGADAADTDVDAIVDLMESELGSSSMRQDASARAKFNSFLSKHVAKGLSLNNLEAKDVTKELFGKLLSFLFNDAGIHWQTSMCYLSSIKRQLEESTGTNLFRADPDWYKRCRRHLQKQYLMLSISTGKKLKEQAPTMTFDDLRSISTILFLKNDSKSLLDRTLLNNQWLAIGRSSDVGSIHFSDLHWHGSYFLIDLTRIKVRQQQSISIFCSPKCWSVDPFHALASQLLVDPYNSSPKVFSQITASNTDAHVAAYINRVLKSVYEFDHEAALTKNLQSHSARRGGAAYASSNASVNLSDLAHRGLWSMDGFATLLESISPTSASDQNVAKVLGRWTDTKQAGHPPSLACFEMEAYQMYTRVNEFAKTLRLRHFSRVGPKGFADCLTATLLMYYRDTLELAPHHILHQELEHVHAMLPQTRSCRDELLDWGRVIRKRFTTENILSLPVHVVREGLSAEEQAEQFVGVHTFDETLQRLLTGYQQLATANEELKSLVHRVLDRLDSLNSSNNPNQMRAGCHHAAVVTPLPSISNDTVSPGAIQLRAPRVGQSWPSSLANLKGKKLSDFLLQYMLEGLGSLPKNPTHRAQKECLRAIEIAAVVANFSTIPPVPPTTQAAARLEWVSAMQRMAIPCETILVNGFAEAASNAGAQRKRLRSGTLTGIVKAWGKLSSHERAAFRASRRVRFIPPRT